MAIYREQPQGTAITIASEADEVGNPRLRRMSVLEVRRLLRKALIGDAATMAAWKAYDEDWHDRERTYATAHARGFERGERGGRI